MIAAAAASKVGLTELIMVSYLLKRMETYAQPQQRHTKTNTHTHTLTHTYTTHTHTHTKTATHTHTNKHTSVIHAQRYQSATFIYRWCT